MKLKHTPRNVTLRYCQGDLTSVLLKDKVDSGVDVRLAISFRSHLAIHHPHVKELNSRNWKRKEGYPIEVNCSFIVQKRTWELLCKDVKPEEKFKVFEKKLRQSHG